MVFDFAKALGRDPRHFQIITLSGLVLLQMFWADFGPSLMIAALTFSSVLVTQLIFSKYFSVPFDYRSPLISGLSLTMLLKSGMWWVYPLAGFTAIACKFLIRPDGKHMFNPANIGIVTALLIVPQYAWVSPGQWGSTVWISLFLLGMAFFVLFKIPSRDIVFLFLGSWVMLIFGRAVWLGDPFAIPWHQLQNGALLIFTFFMISDPKTIPNHFNGRAIFALAVAVTGFILQFEFQLREGLFYALALVCLVRPMIDRIWQAVPYRWGNTTLQTKGINL